MRSIPHILRNITIVFYNSIKEQKGCRCTVENGRDLQPFLEIEGWKHLTLENWYSIKKEKANFRWNGV